MNPTLRGPAPGSATVSVGRGSAIGHHGELLQGTFADLEGAYHRALVTLPLPQLVTKAEFRPRRNDQVTVAPAGKQKACRAAELVLSRYAPGFGGHLTISGEARAGIGMGSSTSDVTAALRAVADCLGLGLTPRDIGRLAVQAEGASDSVMFTGTVLFAHRSGQVLEELADGLPAMLVAGCDTDPGRGGVDTLAFPPPGHCQEERASFGALRDALRRALATGSVPELARIAEASAAINQRYLPTRGFDALRRIAKESGGLGVQVSHSGTLAGIIYDGLDWEAARRGQRLLRESGFHEPWLFATPGPRATETIGGR